MRPRRSTLYAIEETIASLHEELQFTLNYAHAMVRDKNYRAAAEVIEEQRRSLARATKRMEKAIAPEPPVRRQARVRAALVGVAAAMALASGAFAAFGPNAPKPVGPSRIEAIQQASAAYTEATTVSDPVRLQELVVGANLQILEVANQNPSDLLVQRSLLETVNKLRVVLKTNPNLPASVREQAKQVADRVEKAVVDVAEETQSETKTTTETSPDTSAPSAEQSV